MYPPMSYIEKNPLFTSQFNVTNLIPLMNLKHPSLSNETLMVQAQARECYEVIIDIIK